MLVWGCDFTGGGCWEPPGLTRGTSAEPASLWGDQGLDVWVPQFPATLSWWEEGPWRPKPSRGTILRPEGPEMQRPPPADQAWPGATELPHPHGSDLADSDQGGRSGCCPTEVSSFPGKTSCASPWSPWAELVWLDPSPMRLHTVCQDPRALCWSFFFFF